MKPMRILLVDDDEPFLNATAVLLRRAGYDLVTASGYYAALDILDSEVATLDVLVTDLVLDRGNGVALSRAARFRNPAIATVYISAFDLPASDVGDPVLRKPVGPEMIASAVELATADTDSDRRSVG